MRLWPLLLLLTLLIHPVAAYSRPTLAQCDFAIECVEASAEIEGSVPGLQSKELWSISLTDVLNRWGALRARTSILDNSSDKPIQVKILPGNTQEEKELQSFFFDKLGINEGDTVSLLAQNDSLDVLEPVKKNQAADFMAGFLAGKTSAFEVKPARGSKSQTFLCSGTRFWTFESEQAYRKILKDATKVTLHEHAIDELKSLRSGSQIFPQTLKHLVLLPVFTDDTFTAFRLIKPISQRRVLPSLEERRGELLFTINGRPVSSLRAKERYKAFSDPLQFLIDSSDSGSIELSFLPQDAPSKARKANSRLSLSNKRDRDRKSCGDNGKITVSLSKEDLSRITETQVLSRSVPYIKGGESIGIRVFALKTGGPNALLGLKNGDILIGFKINDGPFTPHKDMHSDWLTKHLYPAVTAMEADSTVQLEVSRARESCAIIIERKD